MRRTQRRRSWGDRGEKVNKDIWKLVVQRESRARKEGEKVGEIELMSCFGEVFLSRKKEKEKKELEGGEERRHSTSSCNSQLPSHFPINKSTRN